MVLLFILTVIKISAIYFAKVIIIFRLSKYSYNYFQYLLCVKSTHKSPYHVNPF